MHLKVDPNIAKVAEFMYQNVPAHRLLPVARGLVTLMEILTADMTFERTPRFRAFSWASDQPIPVSPQAATERDGRSLEGANDQNRDGRTVSHQEKNHLQDK